ncbi:Ankyrin repeat-containing protein [Phytophthora cinnamomi]|uniref:Ankyrin repeat-containing protein n=1 Tax=Phytophthora cinnamomi TaxID=4785 RepID=UPI00355AB4AB|nr:Ankyrin repeat-containing protein [Phytophthora cinnamomi]
MSVVAKSSSTAPDWPLLSAAALVTRECLPAAGGALPHVTRRISDFLDTLSRAGVFAASCRRGDSERELSYLFRRDPSPLAQTMVRHAAADGHAHVLKWLKEHDDGGNASLWKDYNFSPMDEAAKTGQLCVLQWLHENVSDCFAGRAMSWAASNGHLEAVKWLHLNRQDLCVNYAMDFAAANGHLHVVQYLHSHRREGCTTWAMDGAATNGHLQVVHWLHQNRREGCTKASVDGAAAHGHLTVVQYLLQTVRLPDEKHWLGWAFTAAADNGRVDVVDWVYSHYREDFSDSMLAFALSAATDNGHSEMAQWLSTQLGERR